jgi:hypothetical protein
MSRKKIYIRKACAHAGCDKGANWTFDSRTAYLKSFEFQRYEKDREPYLCAKHSKGNGVLSPSNLFSEWISEPSKPMEKHPENPYRSFGSRGIIFGEGFCAEGCDFPIGTRIKVTAEVLLPQQEPTP